MILIHINSCFYPTHWYILIHINLCHKKEIESWRYHSPSWLSHGLSPSSCCATLLSCAVDRRHPHRCLVHCLPLLRCAPLPRCCRHRSLRAAATALPPLRCAPPPRCRRCCTAAIAAAPLPSCRHCCQAAAAPPFVGWLLRCCPPFDFVIACRHVTVGALIANVNIFVRIGIY